MKIQLNQLIFFFMGHGQQGWFLSLSVNSNHNKVICGLFVRQASKNQLWGRDKERNLIRRPKKAVSKPVSGWTDSFSSVTSVKRLLLVWLVSKLFFMYFFKITCTFNHNQVSPLAFFLVSMIAQSLEGSDDITTYVRTQTPLSYNRAGTSDYRLNITNTKPIWNRLSFSVAVSKKIK